MTPAEPAIKCIHPQVSWRREEAIYRCVACGQAWPAKPGGASPDTPGVPPVDVPRPDGDLEACSLTLSGNGIITVDAASYDAAGRVFKWLMGQMHLARGA